MKFTVFDFLKTSQRALLVSTKHINKSPEIHIVHIKIIFRTISGILIPLWSPKKILNVSKGQAERALLT